MSAFRRQEKPLLVHGRRKKKGKGASWEREWGEETKKKRKERKRFWVFKTQIYTLFGFCISNSFLRNLILFSIFSKYDAKMNFQVTILN